MWIQVEQMGCDCISLGGWPKPLSETTAPTIALKNRGRPIAELSAMLKPCPDDSLKIWPVDKAVGNVRNKGPQLIAPLNDGGAPALV